MWPWSAGFGFVLMMLCLGHIYSFREKCFFPRHASTRFARNVNMAVRDYSPPNVESIQRLGADAVGTGCLLIAPKHEYNHFLMEQVVLLYEADENGYRGVILERPTAFTVDEMVPGLDSFEENYLFTGGEDGGRTVIMVHPHGEPLRDDSTKKKNNDLAPDQSVKFKTVIGDAKPIGSGLFVGGVEEAKKAVGKGLLPAEDFKFFFNHVRLSQPELNAMLDDGGWRAIRLHDGEAPKCVLTNGNSDLWRILRRRLGEDPVNLSGDDESDDGDNNEAKELIIEMDKNQ